MPLFSDPRDPPGLRQSGRALAQSGALLLGLFGWCTVGLGLAHFLGWLAVLAAFGLTGAVLQQRSFGLTLAVELTALAAAFAALPEDGLEWAVAGAALILAGRALSFARLRLQTGL